MRIFRNTLLTIVLLVAGTFLHYTLPQHDVVRVVNTYQERQDLGDWTRIFWANPDDQSGTLINRDVQFIQTVKKKTWLLGFFQRDSEKVMVYRNEDTGWSWPPYFKFDTASLQTEADDLRSTPEAPKWAVLTHYGWRLELFSAFPNAVAIKPIASPDMTIIPWFNIIFFIIIIALILFLRAMWMQFRERTIDPALEDTRDAWEKVDAGLDEKRGRLSRWWRSWTGR
ncbi:DUF1523 family protein [Sinisalibacter aestuarii]|uniref:DUF1523 family protein n=1 Tax=Sinisalibacter aestuarii TaxID=2949426 RepID=A0ABQ5LV53_9RHOB|nr:DUF1523 family protein [Sinisalibacter aestuarii]GKY88206.1 hypothetical protein STA1M1_20750 [Sinisalibacter aestuarii]